MEGEMNVTNEPGSNGAKNIFNQGQRVFDETKRTMGQAYDKSARAIGQTYDQALDYGRQNPGKTALISFGVGVGIGMLLMGSNRRGRMSRYGEPVVNALSNMATEFIRRL